MATDDFNIRLIKTNDNYAASLCAALGKNPLQNNVAYMVQWASHRGWGAINPPKIVKVDGLDKSLFADGANLFSIDKVGQPYNIIFLPEGADSWDLS